MKHTETLHCDYKEEYAYGLSLPFNFFPILTIALQSIAPLVGSTITSGAIFIFKRESELVMDKANKRYAKQSWRMGEYYIEDTPIRRKDEHIKICTHAFQGTTDERVEICMECLTVRGKIQGHWRVVGKLKNTRSKRFSQLAVELFYRMEIVLT